MSASGAWPLRRQPLISRPIAISYFNNVSDGSEGRRCVAADVSVRVCFFLFLKYFWVEFFFAISKEGGACVRRCVRRPSRRAVTHSFFGLFGRTDMDMERIWSRYASGRALRGP